MVKEHDERAKLIAEQALDGLGEVRREVEIPATDALRIDIWFLRRFFPRQLPGYLLLLAALFDRDCIIEVFSRAVSESGFWESVRKQFTWRRQLERDLERDGEGVVVPPPRMWVLSTGRPDALFERYEIVPRLGFPRGVYEFGGRGWDIGLVVVAELPAQPETLLLRLMGSPAVCRGALRELKAMPTEEPETKELWRLVACLRHTFSRANNGSDEDREEIMTAAWAEFERYEQELVGKGLKKGAQEAQKNSILLVLQARGIALSEENKRRIMACEDPAQLDRWLLAAVSSSSEAALFA